MLLFTNKYVVEDVISWDVAFCCCRVVPSIVKECSTSMFRVKQPILLGLHNSEHEGTTLFRNVGATYPDAVSHSRRHERSATLL